MNAPFLPPPLKALCCCLLAAALAGCAAANSALGGNTRQSALANAGWPYAKEALVLDLTADERLNAYDDEAHTLLLGVYQMADPAPFYKLIGDPEALAKTLESGNAGDGFVDFSRHVVEPGQQTVLRLDRAQGARFVGISAGYYQLAPSNITRLFSIPLQVDSSGWIARTYTATPAPLGLRLQLGAEGIIGSQRLSLAPGETPPTTALPPDPDGKGIALNPETLDAAIHMVNTARALRN